MSLRFRAVLIAGALAALATPAAADFDGSWNVRIVARQGICEGGRIYPVQISNGEVSSSDSSVNVSGRVGETGAISVVVGRGYQRAAGSGRLSGTSGSGTWRASLCSGTWTAQRI
jgi:hypothetical protein